MEPQAILLALALAFPPPASAKNDPEGHARWLTTASSAIHSASQQATCTGPWKGADWCRAVWVGTTRDLSILLLMKARYEGGLDPRIQAGRCRIDECDAERLPGGGVYYKSRSVFQLRKQGPVIGVWDQIVGLESVPVFEAAYAAAQVLGMSRNYCRRAAPAEPWLTATIALYATGSRCEWSGAARRAATFSRLRARWAVLARE